MKIKLTYLFLAHFVLFFSCQKGPGGTVSSGVSQPVVLGQIDFNSNVLNAVPTASNNGGGEFKLVRCGNRLLLGDYRFHRVLIWNSIPLVNNQSADLVLGQSDFVSKTCLTSPTSKSLCFPGGLYCSGSKLFVADYGNRRILVWNTFPTQNYQSADLVLGQPSFTSLDAIDNMVATTIQPWHITGFDQKLIVTDYGKSRILIWNSLPTAINQAADVVVGASDFLGALPSDLNAGKLSNPYESQTDGIRLFVADSNNGRVLLWNNIPLTNGEPADVVIGRPDFLPPSSYPVDSRTLGQPTSLFVYNGMLYVNDTSRARILRWNSIPTSNYTPADAVFGQSDFTSTGANTGGVSMYRLSAVTEGLWVDDQYTIVGDPANNRVLIFPTSTPIFN